MTKGINAATGIATASITHHVIIHIPTANTLLAPGDINVSGIHSNAITNNNGPRKKPMTRAERSCLFT
jgi:hypothetical protein